MHCLSACFPSIASVGLEKKVVPGRFPLGLLSALFYTFSTSSELWRLSSRSLLLVGGRNALIKQPLFIKPNTSKSVEQF